MPSHEEKAREMVAKYGTDEDPLFALEKDISAALRTAEIAAYKRVENLVIEAAIPDAARRHLRQSIRDLANREGE